MDRLAPRGKQVHQPEREERAVADPGVERGRGRRTRQSPQKDGVGQPVLVRTSLRHCRRLLRGAGASAPACLVPMSFASQLFPPPRYRVRERVQTRGNGSWNGPKRLWARSPRDRRGIGGRGERLQVRHQPPDRLRRQHAPEGRHAARAAVIDRLEDGAVGSAVAPAAIGETGPLPPDGAHGVTAVTIERAEQLLPVRRRPLVTLEGILETLGGGWIAAREDMLLVAHGRRRRLLRRRDDQREQRRCGYNANSHTMPPRLVCRAMSGMTLNGGRTSAGSSERASPASSAQSPPMPADTATDCLPPGPVNVIRLPTTPDPTLNFHRALPVFASTALNQPSRVP